MSFHFKTLSEPYFAFIRLLFLISSSPNWSRSIAESPNCNQSILGSENCKKMVMMQHFSKLSFSSSSSSPFTLFLSSHFLLKNLHGLVLWVSFVLFFFFSKSLIFFSKISPNFLKHQNETLTLK